MSAPERGLLRGVSAPEGSALGGGVSAPEGGLLRGVSAPGGSALGGVSAPGERCLLHGGCLLQGGCLLPGGGLLPGGYLLPGGLLSGGCLLLGGVSQHALRQTPPVDRHTFVKILPWPNFVSAGNKRKEMPTLIKEKLESNNFRQNESSNKHQ